MVMNSLLHSIQIACSFTVFPSVRVGVLNCPLFPFKRLFSTVAIVLWIRKLRSYWFDKTNFYEY